MLKDKIKKIITAAINKACEGKKLGSLESATQVDIIIEKPKNPDFGDFSINVSPYARAAKIAPPLIAQNLAEFLTSTSFEVNIIGGFMNFKLSDGFFNEALQNILTKKATFGANTSGGKEKVMLEYISANPTGPLHIGHGRWACMGSALANLLKFSGYDIYQEFYINDAGNQINNLSHSLFIRVMQELGENINFPTDEAEVKNFYTGEYLIQTAKDFIAQNPETAAKIKQGKKHSEFKEELADFAKKYMLDEQKRLLQKLNVEFDNYYSELDLHRQNKVVECLEKLKQTGHTFEKDGALWFKSTTFGDDQDRVLIKNDGAYTYLSADIAYHIDKMQRGFERLINIWGADHHGYVARIKASLEAFSYDPTHLEVLLGQLVNLLIDGEQVRMGKRKKMITLEDLVDEVGADATRFWMIMRSIDTTLDFDVDLAKSKADENPVFYVQYAHARACSIIRNALAKRVDTVNKIELEPAFSQDEIDETFNTKEFSPLYDKKDKAYSATKTLLLKLDSFEDMILSAAKLRAPYLIAKYAQELAGDFHRFYSVARVITEDKDLSKSRIAVVLSVQTVLKNALDLLGVSAPEAM
ncbi:MAG: arginine--tRNA ligase [Candidatus Gastranaerophilales bacterium]|nr:arginine--tRNA ligase [Candidatus Gastranaerophilales bacterium]